MVSMNIFIFKREFGILLEEVLMYLCIKYNNWKRD